MIGRNESRIAVTHVGALPGPKDLWKKGVVPDPQRLAAAVDESVAAQRAAGVDYVNEGELTKGGHWTQFIASRLSGFEPSKGETQTLTTLMSSADWRKFDDFYAKSMARGNLFEDTGEAPAESDDEDRVDWLCTKPLTYIGTAACKRATDALIAGLRGGKVADAFLTSTAPMSVEFGRFNRYYKDDETYVYALAEALREEYEAIAATGLQVQVDDAWLAALWDRIGIPMGLDAYKRYCTVRIDALNHALRNIPEGQIRYHLCWGSWHGPHAYDIPMADVVDLLLRVKARVYLFEAANARHEHEYVVWENVKLPDGKILAPGVVSHATKLIEHPELVALRIRRFAELVGRENVIASTDCGLGLRCHPQIAWAKLKALSEGAALASKRLWKP